VIPRFNPSRNSGHLDRRRFFCGVAAFVLAPFAAADGTPPDRRSLSFVHTHTGETLSTVYFQNGNYLAPSLEHVNQFLRDFRTNEVHSIDPALLDILFDLQARARHAGPFEVISGYRSPQTNAALRSQSSAVAEHSLHMEGRAIDVRMSATDCVNLAAHAEDLKRGGVGYYRGSDFVHLDTGAFRTWKG
jgi:uncharacterized protein YcbK (DUF882 family)